MAKKNPTLRFLNRFIERSDSLVYFVDDQLQIKFANDRLSEWLGAEIESLKDQKLVYSSHSPSEGINVANLCPPPDLFLSEEVCERFWISRSVDGQLEFCEAVAVRIQNSQSSQGLWVIADPEKTIESIGMLETDGLGQNQKLHAKYRQLVDDIAQTQEADTLIGSSAHARRVRKQARAVAEAKCDTLIYGPFGCGKEQLARAIFSMFDDCTSVEFAPVYCAISDGPLIQQRINDARMAMQLRGSNRLVLLLLDVDKLSSEGQSELLGFLELPGMDIRMLATSMQGVGGLSASNGFSNELAFKLGSIEIELLPLRHRIADIPIVVQGLIEKENSRGLKQIAGVSDTVAESFAEYTWPENLNELRRVLASAFAEATGPRITESDLPDEFIHSLTAQRIGRPVEVSIRLDEYLSSIEAALIERAMRQAKSNKTQAAKQLGISRPKLLRRLQQLGLHEFLAAPSDKDDQQIDPSAFEELVEE